MKDLQQAVALAPDNQVYKDDLRIIENNMRAPLYLQDNHDWQFVGMETADEAAYIDKKSVKHLEDYDDYTKFSVRILLVDFSKDMQKSSGEETYEFLYSQNGKAFFRLGGERDWKEISKDVAMNTNVRAAKLAYEVYYGRKCPWLYGYDT